MRYFVSVALAVLVVHSGSCIGGSADAGSAVDAGGGLPRCFQSWPCELGGSAECPDVLPANGTSCDHEPYFSCDYCGDPGADLIDDWFQAICIDGKWRVGNVFCSAPPP